MSKVSLTRPVKPKDHVPLIGVAEACAYLAALPRQVMTADLWTRVAALAVRTRNNPTDAARDELTRQLELVLFLSHRLDLRADHGALQELERIRTAIESFDAIEGVSDDTFSLIAGLWPHLVGKNGKIRPSKTS